MKDKDKNENKELQIFNNTEFGEVRTTVIDGEPWFVGKDIAAALGYGAGKSLANAVANHVDDEDKGVTEMMTPGGNQMMTVINESGVYSLVFGSKLPSAKASHIQAYREVMMAKAGNILAGENILPMPQSGRERHSLGWFCEQIGKPKTWANQLGKILKIKGITKCPGENGEFVEDHAKGNHQKQVQNFEWYVDYLLPIVQRDFMN